MQQVWMQQVWMQQVWTQQVWMQSDDSSFADAISNIRKVRGQPADRTRSPMDLRRGHTYVPPRGHLDGAPEKAARRGPSQDPRRGFDLGALTAPVQIGSDPAAPR